MDIEIFRFISDLYLSNNQEIRFNTNFLEANVINIILLLSGLIYVLKQFLGSIISQRQEKVILAINESEERLKQANLRLNEAEKQLAQTQLIIEQIIQEAEVTAKRVQLSILEQGEIDVEKLNSTSKTSIFAAEDQVKKQIQQKIIALAIDKVTQKLKSQMTLNVQNRIIDQNIMKLEGNINI